MNLINLITLTIRLIQAISVRNNHCVVLSFDFQFFNCLIHLRFVSYSLSVINLTFILSAEFDLMLTGKLAKHFVHKLPIICPLVQRAS